MVAAANSLEGGAAGTTVTTGNSGGASGDAFESVQVGTGATNRFSAAHSRGSLAVEFATGGTAATPACGWTTLVGTRTEVWYRCYVYLTANPTVQHRILHAHSGATQRCSVSIRTDGLLQMMDSVGSTVVGDRTTQAIALNAWNRIEFHAILDPTVGQYEVRLYKTDPDAAIASFDEQVSSAANKNLGGSGDTWRFGITGTAVANVPPWWADDLVVSTDGWPGPSLEIAPPEPIAFVPRVVRRMVGRLRTYSHVVLTPVAVEEPGLALAAVGVSTSTGLATLGLVKPLAAVGVSASSGTAILTAQPAGTPDRIIGYQNLDVAATVTALWDDPVSPDAVWLPAVNPAEYVDLIVSFPTPAAPPGSGGPTVFQLWLRRAGSGADPTVSIDLLEDLQFRGQLTTAVITSTSGQLVNAVLNPALLTNPDGSAVQLRIRGGGTDGWPDIWPDTWP